MIVILSISVTLTAMYGYTDGCQNVSFPNGALSSFQLATKPGDITTVNCIPGYSTYAVYVTCGDNNQWQPTPECHQVAVKFTEESQIKYTHPITFNSIDSLITLSFSTSSRKASNVILRLTSKKMPDGSRDSITIEIVGGFIAATMQLTSSGQNIIGFCHDNVMVNDGKVHTVQLTRDMASLAMRIDRRSIQCTYPSGSTSSFKFTSLKTVSVGHLQANWGSDYGFNGCISDLVIDGLAPLVMADVKENTDINVDVVVSNIEFVTDCGEKYVEVTDPPMFTTTLNTSVITGAVGGPGDKEKSDKTMLYIIIITIGVLILIVLLIGIICKKFYNNKGTYKVEEAHGVDAPEKEYFI